MSNNIGSLVAYWSLNIGEDFLASEHPQVTGKEYTAKIGDVSLPSKSIAFGTSLPISLDVA